MKNLFYGFLATVLISVLGFSQEKIINKFDDFIIFGEIHNQYLEYYYNNVDKKTNDLFKTNVSKNIPISLTNFIKTKKELENFSKEISNGYLSFNNNYCNNEKFNFDSNEVFKRDMSSNLSTFQLKYLDEILSIDDLNSNDYKNKITKLMVSLENDNNLKDEEKHLIFYSAAIGINSFQYWEDNFNLWSEKYGNQSSTTSKINWKAVVKADVGGGISGGIGGAFGGAVIIPVVGSVPGWVVGAVGGALGGSIAEVCLSWW